MVQSQSAWRSTFLDRQYRSPLAVFEQEACCRAFLEICSKLKEEWPFKLVAYVLMPDHIHLIVNPKDGRIRELAGTLKSLAARRIIDEAKGFSFLKEKPDRDGSIHQVWQESFKAIPLWSAWLIWQKINYIHNNPIKAGLVSSACDYCWSSSVPFTSAKASRLKLTKTGGGRTTFRNWREPRLNGQRKWYGKRTEE